MISLLEWVSLIAGLGSAALWGLSTREYVRLMKVEKLDSSVGKDGDIAYELEDGTILAPVRKNVGDPNTLNAWAAALTALAILLQNSPKLLALFGVLLT